MPDAPPSASAAHRRARGRPRLEDVAALDAHLLGIALAEFLEQGYGGASLTRIVRAAKVSKTTLYARYASKGDLFRAIMRRQIAEQHGSQLLQPAGRRLDLAGGLRNYALRMLDFSLEGEMLQVNRLIYSESGRFAELAEAAAERSRVGIDQVARFIDACAKAEDRPCRDPRGVAEAYILMMRGWYVDVMLSNREVGAAERDAWIDRALHALLNSVSDW